MSRIRFVGRHLEEIVASACLLAMCVATFANVVARYGANMPIQWAEELARYAFIWLVFVGAAVCTKRGRHIAVDAAVNLLPAAGQAWCRVLVDVAVLSLMAILIWYGMVLTVSATQKTSTLNIPTYWIYVVIPLSALSVGARTLAELKRNLRALVGLPP